MNSTLEITENEYLIKLNRSRFNLSFVRSLLQIVEVSGPSEEKAKRASANIEPKFVDEDDDDLEIPDRHISPSQNHNSEPDYFDSLDEK